MRIARMRQLKPRRRTAVRLIKLLALAALLGIWNESAAQTVTSPVDSVLNIVDSKTKRTWIVWPLVESAGALVQVEPPATDITLSGGQVLTTFQASATPYTLVGVRVGVVMEGMGYYMTDCPPQTPPSPCTKPFRVDKLLPPLSVPAGSPVEITYNMVLSGDTSVIASVGDTRAPTAPANLSAAPLGATAASLAWAPSWDNVGVSSYVVERCTSLVCTAFVRVGSSQAATPYMDVGLAGAQSYSYRVQALDLAGNRSAYSNIAAMTTPVPPPPPPPPPPVCVRIPPVDPAIGLEVQDFTAKMTDSAGAVWTIAPRVLSADTLKGQVSLFRNGVRQFGGIFYAYIKGTAAVCVTDDPKTGPPHSCFNGTGWNAVAGAPACP